MRPSLRFFLFAVTVLCVGLSLPEFALGFAETPYTGRSEYGDTCWNTNCHAVPNNDGTGPHGNYSATSQVCGLCHSVHEASADGIVLLPRQTITSMCFMCHDGTGSPGVGVYGSIIGRGGVVMAEHSVNTTNVVPGGDPGGGDGTMAFSEGGVLGCGDCHSVHGSDTVARFAGERARNSVKDTFRNLELRSTRLLKRRPGDTAAPVDEYGSDWCLACHQGRASGTAAVHNHPVESSFTESAPYVYDRVPRMYSETATSQQVVGSMGRIAMDPATGLTRVRHNRAFVMPWPRTPLQDGRYPICMQCHEDARSVGEVGAIATATVTMVDGRAATDNPQFQNFPHESTNIRFLVETDDDLCLNCHPVPQLP
jgi:predicted CXXCH cytochrome family protein